MACPLFHPESPAPISTAAHYPLGDLWNGRCSASGRLIDGPALHLCNMGYARAGCPNFTESPDAVRFAIAAVNDNLIQLRYSLEQDHHPHAQGTLVYSRQTGTLSPSSSANLTAQAQAYIQSFLRRI